MEIEKLLRQLHKIEPDQAYARDSRARLIMLMANRSQMSKITLQAFMAGVFRSGFAMAAIGLMLFFAIGGSVWKLIMNPVAKLAKWDSNTLLAEAQAIDTQIRLAGLQYSDPGYERQRLISPDTDFGSIAIVTKPQDSELPATTPAEATTASSTDADADADADSTVNLTSTSTPAEPEDTTVDVEEALDILSH